MVNKRVLHVFATLDKGGAESRILDVYRNLNEKVQFDFLVLDNKDHYYDAEVKSLGGKKYTINHPKNVGVLRHFLELYTLIKNEGPYQAVHSHTSYHQGIVALAAKAARVPNIICHSRTTSSLKDRGLKFQIALFLGRKLINLAATKKLAISKEAGEFLFNTGEFTVVPNAIDIERFFISDKTQKEKMDFFNIDEADIIMGHVGRFAKMKNQKFLVDICNKMIDNGINAHLVLVGEGQLRKDVTKLAINQGIINNVHFLGLREDVPEILKSIDVFVMPSLYEGLGGGAIEAQAAGVPCVTSDKLPEEINMGLGLLKKISLEDSIEQWIKIITNQINIDRPTNKSIKRNFEKKKFTIDEEVTQLCKAYNIILK
ncbi:glycosyltransferase family 1 protein [Halobacillus litoralis]|uniref:Glycosyltransferase family 1 protein n=1 Tax=Halobacillus litoralis TaxID=45668 RepID=A0A410MFG9_9BACI|nr:glycosyltransferase family 1 protein [Halobacillus litoralis]QAS53447.1 hypothetical protein HLI_15190 [Halobacillus litoralis]